MIECNVIRPQPFLTIHLDRFYEECPNDIRKDSTPFVIDLKISLPEAHEYELHSAVLHIGSPIKGHYSTLVREASNQWVVIID